TFRIESWQWQVTPPINPHEILSTYHKMLSKAAPSRNYCLEANILFEIVNSKSGKKKTFLEFFPKDNSWVIHGKPETALKNAKIIGLTSPYLKLLQHNLGQIRLLGVSSSHQEMLFYNREDPLACIKHSSMFTLRLARFIHYLDASDPCSENKEIYSLNKLASLDPCKKVNPHFWNIRYPDVTFVTSVLARDDRYPEAYDYLVSKMSKNFHGSVLKDSYQLIAKHDKKGDQFRHDISEMSSNNMTKKERLGFFGIMFALQHGSFNCNLDEFLSRSGLGDKPDLFIDCFVDREFSPIKAKKKSRSDSLWPFRANQFLSHGSWSIDIAYFDTQRARLDIQEMEKSLYFHLISSHQGFSSYSCIMDTIINAEKQLHLSPREYRKHKKSLRGAHALAYRVHEANKQFTPRTSRSDNVFAASMAKVEYHSYTDMSMALVLLSSRQDVIRCGKPTIFQVLEKGVEVRHAIPNPCVIRDKIRSILKLIKSPNKKHKEIEITGVIDLLFELTYQKPFMSGGKTFAETLCQALFYLISVKYNDPDLACYWPSYKGVQWDVVAYGSILDETFTQGAEVSFIQDFKAHILRKHPWNITQRLLLKEELSRLGMKIAPTKKQCSNKQPASANHAASHGLFAKKPKKSGSTHTEDSMLEIGKKI
ncbi:MAG: hypothetical protein VXW87_03465, partial [Pseudomonadota bacterium]|nr:hypothetical protein [Pseudomonadota bacterium]